MMMDKKTPMATDNPAQDAPGMQDNPETAQDGQDTGTGIDQIIAKVDSYIKDPRLVTPQTLQELKVDLEDLKSYLDKEETGEGEPPDQGSPGGLAIIIGQHKGMGNK